MCVCLCVLECVHVCVQKSTCIHICEQLQMSEHCRGRPRNSFFLVVANFCYQVLDQVAVVLGCVDDRITNITQKCIKLTIP